MKLGQLSSTELSVAHPSFRVISTASKSLPLKDWLSDEHANMFFAVPSQPMTLEEEEAILLETGCPPETVKVLLAFATKYRESMSMGSAQKNRKLGTRSLVRIARRLSFFPKDDDLYSIISQSLLTEFLPVVERLNIDNLLNDAGITKGTVTVGTQSFTYSKKSNRKLHPRQYYPPPIVQGDKILFPQSSNTTRESQPTPIPCFEPSQDPEGVASHVPHMDHFYDNSLQNGLMRNLAVDLELLDDHLVLLGNQVCVTLLIRNSCFQLLSFQGVGKNKIVDR
jgi:hypothetical protein